MSAATTAPSDATRLPDGTVLSDRVTSDAPVPPPPRLHLGHIDGLRALAALFVVSVHYLPLAWGKEPPSNVIFKGLAKSLSGGHFAVSAFIVISGFCLMLPALRDGLQVKGGYGRFVQRRFWRIAPPLYAAFLFAVLLLPLTLNTDTGQVQSITDGLTPQLVLGHLFLVHHLTGLLPSNGPLWSVGVEWWIYFWFPPFLWVWRRFGISAACGLGITGGFALAAVNDYARPLTSWVWCPQYLGLFIAGAWAAWLSCGRDAKAERLRDHPAWLPVSVATFAVLGALVGKQGWEWAYQHISLLDVFIGVSLPALLIALLQERHRPLRQMLGAKPLAFVGVFSYSLYLIHYPLQVAFVPRLLALFPDASQEMRFGLILALFVPLIALAYGFYRAFEAPFHKVARRF